MSKTTDLLSGFGPAKELPETTLPPTQSTIPYDPGKRVPNKFPTITNQPYRIAICGEAPGRDEHYQGTPFVGISGRLLTQFLSKAHIIREACFIGNICQYRPEDNDITRFSFDGPEIKGGLEVLQNDLNKHNPNIVLLLGKTALRAALGKDNIGDWRGSLFISQIPGPFYGRKCIASYHPAACLRQWEWSPLLMMDIKKCKDESTSPELVLPNRTLISKPTYNELCNDLDSISNNKAKVSADIEGGVARLPCCSFAISPTKSVIVPFENLDGTSYWQTEDEELEITKRFVAIMADSKIHKIFQNGLYDRFVLQYGHNTFVAGNTDDTMLQFWEMYCELEKSLGFQGSILTKEQYYKFERKAADRETFYRYCCKDSALTFEVNEKLDKILTNPQKEHYVFNVVLLNALLYMELVGISYDSKLAKQRLLEMENQIYELQYALDLIAGFNFAWEFDKKASLTKIQSELCHKRDPTRPKKGNEESYEWCYNILTATPALTKSNLGRLNIEIGSSMNIRSKIFKDYLYKTLALPIQYKKGKKNEAPKITTDYEALLKLTKKTDHPSIKLAINLGMHRTRAQMLRVLPGPDGRMHCSYNLVGSETARISSSRSMIYVKDGTKSKRVGTNMQTVSDDWDIDDEDLFLLTSGLRNLYCADLDHYLFQCDLRGSDGWTIGAYMAMLGDRTMLDDLIFGLKPAQLVCYLRRHGGHSLDGKQRPEIKELLKEVKKEDWDYYVSKQVIWGTCYLMGPRKVADQILKESYGAVVITEPQAKEFQSCVFARYRVRTWHSWMGHELRRNNNTLTAPNGFKRRFFGRDDEILGQALAHMPQVITTYATNKAMFRLWTDSENRRRNDSPMSVTSIQSNERMRHSSTSESRQILRIEPLHSVHDALIGQFKVSDTTWATNQIKSYFDNPITIAGITLTIPFDGQYGLNWALDDKSKIGSI